MDTINELSNTLIIIIGVGAVFRASISGIRFIFNQDEKIHLKIAINSMIAFIIASSVYGIKKVIEYYFL